MINWVYGYFVKNGGVSRYMAECLNRFYNPSCFSLVTMEKSLELNSNIKTVLVDCDRDDKFLSLKENESFSRLVDRRFNKDDFVHSHGVYDFVPDAYTAHICIKSYFDKLINSFDLNVIPSYLKKFSKLIETEENMLSKIPEDRIIGVSKKVVNDLSGYYGINGKTIKIMPGASRFYKTNRVTSFDKEVFKVGFVGGNLYAKGIVFIKNVLNELISEGINVICVGAGCNDEIIDYFKDECNFRSKLFKKIDINESFYTGLDVFLCLSVYESYSLSALEAMSLGVPVVGSNNIGLFNDFQKCTLARINEISDIEGISQILKRIFFDSSYRKKIIKSGYNICKNHSWEKTVSKYEEFYNNL